ncbi:MAG: hypothetical protein QXV17_07675 [Candidatus Micrarchaeaceae archaeon]
MKVNIHGASPGASQRNAEVNLSNIYDDAPADEVIVAITTVITSMKGKGPLDLMAIGSEDLADENFSNC